MGSDAQFQTQVINAIINGDTSRMPSPFPLAKSGEILSYGTNVHIFISTRRDSKTENDALLYEDRVGQIEATLVEKVDLFNELSVMTWDYMKITNKEVNKELNKLIVGVFWWDIDKQKHLVDGHCVC